ncbi:MAG: C-terminal helicase domain-containing protein, partial [Polyangiaceae bacterium]
LSAAAIHGNKSQGARTRALEGFRDGNVRILVATDIAARGIDVEGIEHVINFDLPNVPETYVHRIGRTARAGAEGIALSMCELEERAYLVDIERLMKRHIDRVDDHPFPATEPPPPITDLSPAKRGGGRSSGPKPNGQRRGSGRRSGPRRGGGGNRNRNARGNRGNRGNRPGS